MMRRLGTTVVAGLIATGGLVVAAGPASAGTPVTHPAATAGSGQWVCTSYGTYTGKDGKQHRLVRCEEV